MFFTPASCWYFYVYIWSQLFIVSVGCNWFWFEAQMPDHTFYCVLYNMLNFSMWNRYWLFTRKGNDTNWQGKSDKAFRSGSIFPTPWQACSKLVILALSVGERNWRLRIVFQCFSVGTKLISRNISLYETLW